MGVDRRTVLARVLAGLLGGAAGGALGGCGLVGDDPPPPHPMLGTLRETRALLARYEAVITAHPGLAARLTPLRDDHRAHARELSALIGPQASASSATSTPAPRASVPVSEREALDDLARAERVGRDAAVRACLDAPPEHAGLFGSIAACRATHLEVLR